MTKVMPRLKVKFVSKKISKIRWQPKSSSVFVTGTYNDEDNKIMVWSFPDTTFLKEDNDNFIDDDPQIQSSIAFQGCVTDLKTVSEDLILSSSSCGSVFLYRYSKEDLNCVHQWNNLHTFKSTPASVTGLAVKSNDIASVGEDGKLCIMNFNINQKVREIADVDQCSLTCVAYIRHQEVVAGNSLGYLRLWDLRTPSEASSSLISPCTREIRSVSSMSTHPTQSHILATGYEDGSMAIWDMRQDRKPVALQEAHSASISDIVFHPTNPDFLYTCSWDGSVWQWDSSDLRKANAGYSASLDNPDQSFSKGNPWLICDAYKNKLEVTHLSLNQWTCVNSLDHCGSTLIWATDNEELRILSDMAL